MRTRPPCFLIQAMRSASCSWPRHDTWPAMSARRLQKAKQASIDEYLATSTESRAAACERKLSSCNGNVCAMGICRRHLCCRVRFTPLGPYNTLYVGPAEPQMQSCWTQRVHVQEERSAECSAQLISAAVPLSGQAPGPNYITAIKVSFALC